MEPVIHVEALSKQYKSGFTALTDINLKIEKGEIFALLGPNGAGKTTLISIICGIVNASSGQVKVNGFDNVDQYRQSRKQIGLVPQELALSMFETVWATIKFSRGLYGCPPDNAYLEQVLKELSLWDKKDSRIMALSGGMKRRVLIAKALAHQPNILFLDEPTAGVDVELRQGMWEKIHQLRESGVTVILTTHYIEEAEQMADRIGVINKGKILLVDQKQALMSKLGKKRLTLHLGQALENVPSAISAMGVDIDESGTQLIYEFDGTQEHNQVPDLLKQVLDLGVEIQDINTTQTSLEDIFVNLVGADK